MKQILYLFILSIIFLSCSEDDALISSDTSFSKLYYATDFIEANDFIETDNGYLILATYFNNNQSGLYLINVDSEGYVNDNDTIRITTDSLNHFERGVTLKEYNNEVYILGLRSNSPFSDNNTDFTSFIFKTNLNGYPISAPENTVINTTIQILQNEGRHSMKMNDFIIKDDKIIFGGTLYSGQSTNRFVQIYDLNDGPLEDQNEYPSNEEIFRTGANTTVLNVVEEENSNLKFSTIGQTFISNRIDSSVFVKQSFSNYNSNSVAPLVLKEPGDKILQAAFQNSSTGILYLTGSNQTGEEIFVSRAYSNPLGNSRDNANNSFTATEYGNNVISIVQNSSFDLYIATTKLDETRNTVSSYLFKLPTTGNFAKSETIEFESSRFYNIKKIKASEKDDRILVLSSLEFENNAGAVGLMKLNF